MKSPRSTGPARLACIDKPGGLTSFDVVARLRRITGCRRIGHGGTLDPFATGVLVVGIGPATRLMRYLAGGRKRYHATIRFGRETDSEDRTGAVLRESARMPSAEELRSILPRFTGTIEQVPPRLSAIHVEGERSYRRARRGEDVQPPPRRVEIHALELLDCEDDLVRIDVDCGGGTYIRALARDLGRALGSAAHLDALRRTRVGPFGLDRALTLDAFAERWEAGERGLDPRELVRGWPVIDLDGERVRQVRHGLQPDPTWWSGGEGEVPPERVALVDGDDGALVAIAESDAGRSLRLSLVLPEAS